MELIPAPSPNFDARTSPPDMIILHYTGMKSAKEAIDRLCDTKARVSSHYVVDENGLVLRLVPEDRRVFTDLTVTENLEVGRQPPALMVGNLEARRGDRDRAACSFHAALATVCPLDLPFEQALVHLDFGTFLHQAGRASEAIDQLRAAHHTFALLDAVPFLERSERELTACGHPSTIICAVRATSSESHTRRALPTG